MFSSRTVSRTVLPLYWASSPRKLHIFIMRENKYWMKVSQKCFVLFWKQNHCSSMAVSVQRKVAEECLVTEIFESGRVQFHPGSCGIRLNTLIIWCWGLRWSTSHPLSRRHPKPSVRLHGWRKDVLKCLLEEAVLEQEAGIGRTNHLQNTQWM